MMQQVEILIKGKIDEGRSDWFEGLAIQYSLSGETILSGPMVDQTALFGLLAKIRDLGLGLVSLQVVERDVNNRDIEDDGGVK
jgi:hypothetical protein